jgi:hypothetical protein
MLKVDRRTELSRIGLRIDLVGEDVQTFYLPDMTSDWDLKSITEINSPSYRLRYAMVPFGRLISGL